MARIHDPATSNPIGYLVSVHFPEYSVYIQDVMTPDRLRNGPRLQPPAELQKAVLAYTSKLKAMSPNEISALVSEAKQISEERRLANLQAEERSRFYHLPQNAADVRHWAKMSYWSPEELCALSLGKDPEIVNWAKISPYKHLSDFVREYERRNTIVTRAKTMGQLWALTPPNLAVAWARRMQFELPADLISEVEELGVQIADWKDFHDARVREISELETALENARSETRMAREEGMERLSSYAQKATNTIDGYKELLEKSRENVSQLLLRTSQLENAQNASPLELGTRARESLLKMILGMAIKKYNFKPAAAKNSATANIATHLREIGMPLDEDTIRNYLTEAKGLLSGDVSD